MRQAHHRKQALPRFKRYTFKGSILRLVQRAPARVRPVAVHARARVKVIYQTVSMLQGTR
jgi:hypothetical protein